MAVTFVTVAVTFMTVPMTSVTMAVTFVVVTVAVLAVVLVTTVTSVAHCAIEEAVAVAMTCGGHSAVSSATTRGPTDHGTSSSACLPHLLLLRASVHVLRAGRQTLQPD